LTTNSTFSDTDTSILSEFSKEEGLLFDSSFFEGLAVYDKPLLTRAME
jgi:hypothetical protein